MLGRPADRVSGDLLLLTVSLGPATAVEALVAWLDGEQDVLPRDDVIPEGSTRATTSRHSAGCSGRAARSPPPSGCGRPASKCG